MTAIVDASVLIALGVRNDPAHARVRATVDRERQTMVVPVAVIAESAFVLRTRLGPRAEVAFARSLAASAWHLEATTEPDLLRGADIVERYLDGRVDLVDALTIAMAERLGVRRIYTLDRRDFAMVKPRHVDGFELLP